VATGKVVCELHGTAALVTQADLRPDAGLAAVFEPATPGKPSGTLKVFDPATGRQLWSVRDERGLTWLRVSPGGERLAVAGPNRPDVRRPDKARADLDAPSVCDVRVFDAPTGRLVSSLPDTAWLQDLTADGRLLLLTGEGTTGPQTLVLADPDSGAPVWSVSLAGWAWSWALNAATGRVALTVSGPEGEGLEVRDLGTGQVVAAVRESGLARQALAFTPDGSRVAVARWDGSIRLYDAGTGAGLLTLRGHSRRVKQLTFSPDGHRLISIDDDVTRVWDASALPARQP
jgi:WD40 repeat protein